MKLLEWRTKKGISQDEMAIELTEFSGNSITQRSISAWEGGRMPRKAWINVISEYTDGKVKANDFA